MGVVEAILAIIKVLPDLIDMIKKLGKQMADKRFHDWMNELDQTTKDLENATTTEQRVAAAQRLSKLARGQL